MASARISALRDPAAVGLPLARKRLFQQDNRHSGGAADGRYFEPVTRLVTPEGRRFRIAAITQLV
jgi:hypothetical protein